MFRFGVIFGRPISVSRPIRRRKCSRKRQQLAW